MKYHTFHKDFRLNDHKFNTPTVLLNYSRKLTDASIHTFLADWFNETTFVKVQTSGSTGKPKIIRLKKEHMINSAIATGTYFDLPAKTKALLCLSTNYIAGKMMLVRALVLGWELDLTTTGSHPLKAVQKTYDFSAMVPLQVHNSIEELFFVKKLIVGGGTVSLGLQQKMANLSTNIYATYGMTETVTHIAVKKLNHFSDVTMNSVERFCYTILPNIKISQDARGCLVIDGLKILNERVITNDLVELISPTEFKWLGRYDTVINSGGIKLIPEQIERKLSKVIDNRFFVSSLPDEALGEQLILLIEGAAQIPDNISNKIKNLTSLHKFEVPKKIYFLDSFIETETKKVNRQQTVEKLFIS